MIDIFVVAERFHLWVGLPFLIREVLHVLVHHGPIRKWALTKLVRRGISMVRR